MCFEMVKLNNIQQEYHENEIIHHWYSHHSHICVITKYMNYC